VFFFFFFFQLIKSVWRDMEQFNNTAQLLASPLLSSLPLSPCSPLSRTASAADDRFSRRFYLTSSHSSQPHHSSEELGEASWQMSKGRPPMSRLFSDMKARMQHVQDEQQQPTSDVRCAVLVCGPEALIARCRRLCSQYSDRPYKCGQRVCFDVHEETYEW